MIESTITYSDGTPIHHLSNFLSTIHLLLWACWHLWFLCSPCLAYIMACEYEIWKVFFFLNYCLYPAGFIYVNELLWKDDGIDINLPWHYVSVRSAIRIAAECLCYIFYLIVEQPLRILHFDHLWRVKKRKKHKAYTIFTYFSHTKNSRFFFKTETDGDFIGLLACLFF